MRMDAISLDATIAITALSRRTWWRRISQGAVNRVSDDERGRAMLSWVEVMQHICIPIESEDLVYILRADAGQADAQNDIGQLFSIAGKHESALYWLRHAVQQDHPDAMQWLGSCYLRGAGVPRDENLGLMWIAKAASHNHTIAQAQINSLLPYAVKRSRT
jgi:TPR repeat protein